MIKDNEITPEFREKMNDLAGRLDQFFNGPSRGTDRKIGFVLLVAPFNDDQGRVNYISNGERKTIVTMMKELIQRFEGQPAVRGTA